MRTAIYPGTFDPFTNGHLDIVLRATELFDSVVIGVAADSNKSTLFSLSERIDLIKQTIKDLPRIEVEGFEGLTVDFARKCGSRVIIRGLRVMADFEYEFQLALMNRKLTPDIETVFLTTKSDFSFISSSAIKWVASLNGSISEFVPTHVEKALILKHARD